jgi:hypothetical protein
LRVVIAAEASRSAAARCRQPMAVSAGNLEERGFLAGNGGCERLIPWATKFCLASAPMMEGLVAPPSFSQRDVASDFSDLEGIQSSNLQAGALKSLSRNRPENNECDKCIITHTGFIFTASLSYYSNRVHIYLATSRNDGARR